MKQLWTIIARPWRDASAGKRLGYGCALPALWAAGLAIGALISML